MENYFLQIKILLILSPIVKSFSIIKYRIGRKDGHLRAKCSLTNDDLFEFSIYVQEINNAPNIENYSFQWQKSDGRLVCRWDNTPHHREISTFPHYVHLETEENVFDSNPVDPFIILEKIEKEIKN